MAFLDDLGKKLSQTSQSANQKIKDMADVSKLNSLISNEEKGISSAYYQLGQLYYSKHSKDAEPELAPLVNQILQAQARIDDIKKQIEIIKGIKRCPFCGNEIPATAIFCNFCGNALSQFTTVNTANLIKCEKCGKMIEKGTKFCTGCGTPVVEKAPVQGKICKGCGKPLEDGTLFCTNCGTRVDAPAPTPITETKPIVDEVPFVQPELIEETVPVAEPAVVEEPVTVEEPVIVEEPVTVEEPVIVEENEPAREVMLDVCSNCGAVLEEGSMFCTNCGKKIGESTSPVQSAVKTCPNCGEPAEDDDSMFCIKCGTKLS